MTETGKPDRERFRGKRARFQHEWFLRDVSDAILEELTESGYSFEAGSVRAVLTGIHMHFNQEDGYAYPGYPAIAACAMVSESTVKRVIPALEDIGVIEKVAGGGRGNPNRYYLTAPLGGPIREAWNGKADDVGRDEPSKPAAQPPPSKSRAARVRGQEPWDKAWTQVLDTIHRYGAKDPSRPYLGDVVERAVRLAGGWQRLRGTDETSAKFAFRDAYKDACKEQR